MTEPLKLVPGDDASLVAAATLAAAWLHVALERSALAAVGAEAWDAVANELRRRQVEFDAAEARPLKIYCIRCGFDLTGVRAHAASDAWGVGFACETCAPLVRRLP